VQHCPSPNDIISCVEIPEPLVANTLEPLDMPDYTADQFLRTLCTPAKTIKQVQMSRKELATYLAHELTKHILACLDNNDTIMGYKKDKGE